VSLGLGTADFKQQGASVLMSRRLTPSMTFSLGLDRSSTDGLAAAAGDYLRDWDARVSLSFALSPTAQATAGLGRHLVRSNRAGNQDETRAHVGLLQNF
jgi:hypothetical protein